MYVIPDEPRTCIDLQVSMFSLMPRCFVLILHKVAPCYLFGSMAIKICFYNIFIDRDMLRSCSLISHVSPKKVHVLANNKAATKRPDGASQWGASWVWLKFLLRQWGVAVAAGNSQAT